MKTTKVLSLVLVVTFIIILLASCSKKEGIRVSYEASKWQGRDLEAIKLVEKNLYQGEIGDSGPVWIDLKVESVGVLYHQKNMEKSFSLLNYTERVPVGQICDKEGEFNEVTCPVGSRIVTVTGDVSGNSYTYLDGAKIAFCVFPEYKAIYIGEGKHWNAELKIIDNENSKEQTTGVLKVAYKGELSDLTSKEITCEYRMLHRDSEIVYDDDGDFKSIKNPSAEDEPITTLISGSTTLGYSEGDSPGQKDLVSSYYFDKDFLRNAKDTVDVTVEWGSKKETLEIIKSK